jgi:hypothetical protein
MGSIGVFVAHLARPLSWAWSDSRTRMQQSLVQSPKTQISCGVTANFLLFVRVKIREVSQVVMYPMTAALFLVAIEGPRSVSALHAERTG